MNKGVFQPTVAPPYQISPQVKQNITPLAAVVQSRRVSNDIMIFSISNILHKTVDYTDAIVITGYEDQWNT